MNNSQHDSGQSGFTLLELLISMTVLSMLLTIVFGGLTFGARAWDKTLSATAAALDIKSAQTLLKSTVEKTYPLYVAQEPGRAYVYFSGSPHHMTFLAPPPHVFAEGGWAVVELQSTGDDNEAGLKLSFRSELGNAAAPQIAEELLLEGASSVTFAYFGSNTRDEPASWRESWENKQTLPSLVRIKAEFPEGDTRTWPELIIAPRIAVDVGCNFDPLTKYCTGR